MEQAALTWAQPIPTTLLSVTRRQQRYDTAGSEKPHLKTKKKPGEQSKKDPAPQLKETYPRHNQPAHHKCKSEVSASYGERERGPRNKLESSHGPKVTS